MNIVAILSTTIAPLDGSYIITTVRAFPNIQGVPHYVGHPDTKEILESLGAVQAPSKLFTGLQAGESAVCVSIAQGKSTRATEGFTTPHQAVTLSDLSVRIMTRRKLQSFYECRFFARNLSGERQLQEVEIIPFVPHIGMFVHTESCVWKVMGISYDIGKNFFSISTD